MMTEITLCDALSLANGAKKAMAEGYESRYMPYMVRAAAKLADDLAVWKSRAEAAENVLQNLMSFLSVNGCRTEIDPANAELRIRDGISMLIKPALARAEAAEAYKALIALQTGKGTPQPVNTP